MSHQYGEQIFVGFVQQFDGMGKGTVFSAVVNLQEPDDRREQHDRRFDKKISLLLYPRTVEIEHDDIAGLVCVGDVGHEIRRERIASVRTARVVEIYDIEFRRRRSVSLEVLAQMVVSDNRQVVELEVVDVERISLFDGLLDVVVDEGIGFSRAGRS